MSLFSFFKLFSTSVVFSVSKEREVREKGGRGLANGSVSNRDEPTLVKILSSSIGI